ncbi:endoglucanase 4-like [Impatiens glandulifera]|uniref:endoglucanase 4-like n=1 Tax=Impatiens glandulifera TaxID=253017 RepID=UPI001FB12C29|nr:endoglucanase 4-like [Impatiens glandulifera]
MAAMTLLLIFNLVVVRAHDYGDALSKSILFFEGQRSGKLPSSQRTTWRDDSALRDGFDVGVDLVGGYYDAGDNVKFNFPMAFSTTMLAWGVIEFGKAMGDEDLNHTLEAIRWATDYFLKSSAINNTLYAQVGDPYGDHNCWERPDDMDTLRTSYSVTAQKPGSELAGEMAAALAASSIAFKFYDSSYSTLLLQTASKVFEFGDKYRGSYNDSLGIEVCPFYCDYGGYEDELIWAAGWLLKATKKPYYLNYINKNIHNVQSIDNRGNFAEFGWDTKNAGINVLLSTFQKQIGSSLFVQLADQFICSLLPDSPSKSVSYSPGGMLYKAGVCNMQHVTSISFLLVVYTRYSNNAKRKIQCDGSYISYTRLIRLAKKQVDYMLGSNPMKMSFMVGYGSKFPQKIHHRGSSSPSIHVHPEHISCKEGSMYFNSIQPNMNLLTGAIVGGPDINDKFDDSRANFVQTEPTTYTNAPAVGLLAYFKQRARNQTKGGVIGCNSSRFSCKRIIY